jgi:hypothetical protein
VRFSFFFPKSFYFVLLCLLYATLFFFDDCTFMKLKFLISHSLTMAKSKLILLFNSLLFTVSSTYKHFFLTIFSLFLHFSHHHNEVIFMSRHFCIMMNEYGREQEVKTQEEFKTTMMMKIEIGRTVML